MQRTVIAELGVNAVCLAIAIVVVLPWLIWIIGWIASQIKEE